MRFVFSFDLVIRYATIGRTYDGALWRVVEAYTLGALLCHDVVHIVR
jgi:hypothetical protein